ncbi:hypothetical protein RchiOBHm_Chr6g0294711 [Rosa chinensis]|uniref:Uncharacterized protein n=1 Tax=Rosa chinensis TaxID=74649 RepID=A0A2P6PWY6_ROSCH|nr:uncharacterized protein LOC112169151 [Rosa chinensis]PRQ26451.1 hypothetical protein RchiOBHm_Chr6g0294711 [Rosa chinensis]
MAPQNSETPLTRAQRQDELLNMFPGTAKVILRPRTNPDGSEIVTVTDYEFPDLRCKLWLKNLYQAMRLCGRDHGNFVADFQGGLKTFCGIEVDLDEMEKPIENGFATSPSSVHQ